MAMAQIGEKSNGMPNFLFILSDQHNPHALGCAGYSCVATPNLDRLAHDGMMFNEAYCQNPLCVPSRSSLITGQYCRDIGIYDNQDILDVNHTTFPEVLAAAGYRTCLIGKAHFNGEQYHGYQERPYGDLLGQAHQPDPRRLPHLGDSGLGDIVSASGPSGIPLPLTQTEICVAETVKWLQTHVGMRRDQPFCLSVNFDKPHFPIKPPLEYFQRYEGKVKLPNVPDAHIEQVVPFVRTAHEVFKKRNPDSEMREAAERTLAAYYGCVEWVDNAIGRILDTLEYLGLAEDTVVIYTSDHGEMAGEHGVWNKSLFYESSSRVPLIVRWPGRGLSGKSENTIVGLMDLFPTLCEIAGIETPAVCQGTSLAPLLTGSGTLERDAVFSESVLVGRPEYAGCMIRTGKWKYVYYLDESEELYDLEADRDEWNNLAQMPEHKSLVDELRNRVIDFWEPDKQMQRYHAAPRMAKQKHFYEYSNQFVMGNGIIVDGRP
jgi:choline-sulfatase